MSIDYTNPTDRATAILGLLIRKIKPGLQRISDAPTVTNQMVENVLLNIRSFRAQIVALRNGDAWADQALEDDFVELPGWDAARYSGFVVSVTGLEADLDAFFQFVFTNQAILLARSYNNSTDMVLDYDTPLNGTQQTATKAQVDACLANYP